MAERERTQNRCSYGAPMSTGGFQEPGFAAQIARICAEYESALREGLDVDLVQIVQQVDQSEQAYLLRELLAIEIEYRKRRGEKVSLEELHLDHPTVLPADNEVLRDSPTERVPDSDPLRNSLDTEFVPERLGAYAIEREIGRGGMGVVYLGHGQDNRPVAIKVLPGAAFGKKSAAERFFREAELGKRLRHPNICRVYDVGQIDANFYFVMEYIAGRTLGEMIRHGESLSLFQCYDLGRQLFETLRFLASEQVIHRDIKPSNLMVCDGHLKVLDLGLAKDPTTELTGDAATMTGVFMGTPMYTAPEQLLDASNVDPRADLFAAGVTLFEMCTGQLPYGKQELFELLQVRSRPQVPDPRELNREIPLALSQVIQQLTQLNPDARPDHDAVLEVLAECLAAAPARRIGQYRLLQPIAQGAQGEVYLAKDEQLQRQVAVKMLSAAFADAPEMRERFEREVRAGSLLNHPNIVQTLGAGTADDGLPYLVTELVQGVNLGEFVGPDKRVRIADACEVARQAADALNHAHENGVIHRDVKPSNLIVSRDGAIKLVDFGIARSAAEDASLTSPQMIFGTPAYMSPEQAAGGGIVGPAADVYSLGATLYALLAGKPPFGGPDYDSPAKILQGLLRDDVDPIEHLRDEVPAELSRVLAKALSREPVERFPSAAQFAEELRPFCDGADLRGLAAGQSEAASAATPATDVPWPDDSDTTLRDAWGSAEPRSGREGAGREGSGRGDREPPTGRSGGKAHASGCAALLVMLATFLATLPLVVQDIIDLTLGVVLALAATGALCYLLSRFAPAAAVRISRAVFAALPETLSEVLSGGLLGSSDGAESPPAASESQPPQSDVPESPPPIPLPPPPLPPTPLASGTLAPAPPPARPAAPPQPEASSEASLALGDGSQGSVASRFSIAQFDLRDYLSRNDEDLPQLGPYELIGQLGETDAVNTYLARMAALGAEGDKFVVRMLPIAIKQLAPERMRNYRRQTARLYKLSNQCEELNRIVVVDRTRLKRLGSFSDQHYVVEEFVEGATLESLIQKTEDADPLILIAWLKSALVALRMLHGSGLVHDNLHPAKLLVNTRTNQLRICDLTRVSPEDDKSAREETIGGADFLGGRSLKRQPYLPMEQLIQGRGPSVAADQYSLGRIFLEVSAGKQLGSIARNAEASALMTHADVEEVIIGLRHKERRVAAVLETMTRLKPALRYPSVEEAMSELDGVNPFGSSVGPPPQPPIPDARPSIPQAPSPPQPAPPQSDGSATFASPAIAADVTIVDPHARIDNQDRNQLTQFLARIASRQPDSAGRWFRGLVQRSDIPSQLVRTVPDFDGGNSDSYARLLVQWALERGIHPKNPEMTILGCLLASLLSDVNVTDSAYVIAFLTHYQLIKNPGLLRRYQTSYQVPTPLTQRSTVRDWAIEFERRGAESENDLQGFLTQDPKSPLLDMGQLQLAIQKAAGVCRVETSLRRGTGFLVAPRLVLTCFHVLQLRMTEDLDEALASTRIRFGCFSKPDGSEENGQTFGLEPTRPLVLHSPIGELDFSLLQLEDRILGTQGVDSSFQAGARPVKRSQLSILQHPDGESMKLGMCPSGVSYVDADGPYLQYVTQTRSGSSGAPCFDSAWNIVAMHRSEKALNWGGAIREGVLMEPIMERIGEHLTSAN